MSNVSPQMAMSVSDSIANPNTLPTLTTYIQQVI